MKTVDGYFLPDTDTHFNMYVFGYGRFYDMLHLLSDDHKRVALDCGAHVGGWTKELAKVFDSVYAFEPSAANFECLKANVGELDNVTLLNCAVGDSQKSGSLHPPVNDGNSGAAWVVDGGDFEIVTIDSLNLAVVDFIKLDVEGFEPFAVEGARETIKRCRPVILLEQKEICARYGLPYDEAGEILKNMGYVEAMKMWNDYVFVPR